METKIINVNKNKKIALVAHDNKKDELLHWVKDNVENLKNHTLIGTGTTAAIISDRTGLEVEGLISGPLGGDQQLGAKICNGEIDMLIFFWDPLETQPHDPDVKALLRISTLYNIAIATSETTANYLLTSPLFNTSYQSIILDNQFSVKERVKTLKVD